MKIKEMDKANTPREKLLKQGAKKLTNQELLAIILRVGSQENNVLEMSENLLLDFGLDGLFNSSLNTLTKTKGMGKTKAMQILAMAELSKRNYK